MKAMTAPGIEAPDQKLWLSDQLSEYRFLPWTSIGQLELTAYITQGANADTFGLMFALMAVNFPELGQMIHLSSDERSAAEQAMNANGDQLDPAIIGNVLNRAFRMAGTPDKPPVLAKLF